MTAAREAGEFHDLTKKAEPRREESSPGFIIPLGLLSLHLLVKPFANVVGSYICHDRHNETNDVLHGLHPLSVASMGRAAWSL